MTGEENRQNMPEVIWAQTFDIGGGEIGIDAEPIRYDGLTSYTRTDLHEAVKQERDAYRDMCERLAGALKECLPYVDGYSMRTNSKSDSSQADDSYTDGQEALAAYDKIKGA